MAAVKRIIAGLGNPGLEYEGTYHNVGAAALYALVHALEAQGIEVPFKTHKDLFEYARVKNVAFVLPLTYMNESGLAVKEALKKFGVKAHDLIVFHDESDLTVGSYRVSAGRSAAGHRGVQSIVDALGSNEFARIRIGIRKAAEVKRKKASEFVLSKISASDKKTLNDVFEKIEEMFLAETG